MIWHRARNVEPSPRAGVPSGGGGQRNMPGHGVGTMVSCLLSALAIGMVGWISLPPTQVQAQARTQARTQALAEAPLPPAAPTNLKGSSGLPVPRFVSLKSDKVNMRTGPGHQYPVKWVYRRAGLPVEVMREFEGWRQVRDAEGISGWIVGTLLSGRRTAVVAPWEQKRGSAGAVVALMASERATGNEVVRVEAGVIANVRHCNGTWCAVSVDDYRGFIDQKKLWGVYPNEQLK